MPNTTSTHHPSATDMIFVAKIINRQIVVSVFAHHETVLPANDRAAASNIVSDGSGQGGPRLRLPQGRQHRLLSQQPVRVDQSGRPRPHVRDV